jgi:hypothetical protein
MRCYVPKTTATLARLLNSKEGFIWSEEPFERCY